MKPETEGAQWEAVEWLGAGSRQRRGQGRIHGPGSTTAHSINPHRQQGENLICLQHMQALIYKCFRPLRNKKRGDLKPFNINPVTAKWQTGDKREAEGKYSICIWSLISFSRLTVFFTFSIVKLEKMRTINTVNLISAFKLNTHWLLLKYRTSHTTRKT